MKLLLDMNVSPRLVPLLRAEGFDAIHWTERGEPSAPDLSIAEAASEQNAVVITHDLDFGALLAGNARRRPSVIQIRADDLSVERLLLRILAACAEFGAELDAGALLSLDVENTRVRMLPIRQ